MIHSDHLACRLRRQVLGNSLVTDGSCGVAFGSMSLKSRKDGSPSVSREPSQYREALARRFRLLSTACAAFDAGDDDHVVDIAAYLRLLLQDRLIDKVTPLGAIEFADTAQHLEEEDAERGYGFGVTRIMVYEDGRDGGRIVAPLGGAFPEGAEPPRLPFARWWSSDFAVYPTKGPFLTRQYVVYEMANTDGIHVDDLLDEDYDALIQDTHGFQYNGHSITGNVATAAVRQIAWETQHTLHRVLPDLCGPDFPSASPTEGIHTYWRITAVRKAPDA